APSAELDVIPTDAQTPAPTRELPRKTISASAETFPPAASPPIQQEPSANAMVLDEHRPSTNNPILGGPSSWGPLMFVDTGRQVFRDGSLLLPTSGIPDRAVHEIISATAKVSLSEKDTEQARFEFAGMDVDAADEDASAANQRVSIEVDEREISAADELEPTEIDEQEPIEIDEGELSPAHEPRPTEIDKLSVVHDTNSIKMDKQKAPVSHGPKTTQNDNPELPGPEIDEQELPAGYEPVPTESEGAHTTGPAGDHREAPRTEQAPTTVNPDVAEPAEDDTMIIDEEEEEIPFIPLSISRGRRAPASTSPTARRPKAPLSSHLLDATERVIEENGRKVLETLDTPEIRKRRNAEAQRLRKAQQMAFQQQQQESRGASMSIAHAKDDEVTQVQDVDVNAEALPTSTSMPPSISTHIVSAGIKKRGNRSRLSTVPKLLTPQVIVEPAHVLVEENAVLEGGTIVWAQAKSYPWWPAVIWDPNDYFVPANIKNEHYKAHTKRGTVMYVVQFFDKHKSWQILPHDALRMLGEDH
ncbi:hypothetical protein H0H87_008062, partial [Tephrocybe sp. NHM501043]